MYYESHMLQSVNLWYNKTADGNAVFICRQRAALCVYLRSISKNPANHKGGLLDRIKMNAIDRFMQYVEKSNSCWNWIGTKDHNGYGMFYLKGSNTRIASRISWILLVGEIPANKCVLHKCDNPACVNPDHLYLGTHKQNTRDMMDRNRRYQPNVSGENNGRSKITKKHAEEIRIRAKSGVATKQLIQDYGLCRTVIRYIIRGHLWKTN